MLCKDYCLKKNVKHPIFWMYRRKKKKDRQEKNKRKERN